MSMNTFFDNLNRTHDLAHCQADVLRREAMDDFWRGADGLLAMGADRAGRSAQRLADRLARRAHGRNTRTPTVSSGV
jgi:hypothetical protein